MDLPASDLVIPKNLCVFALTFSFPVGLRSESYMAAVLAVEFSHEGLVWVADHQDAGVEGLDFFPATFVCFYANSPATAPVIPLPFKTCRVRRYHSYILWEEILLFLQ